MTPNSQVDWATLDLPLDIDLSGAEARTGTLLLEEVNDGSLPVYFDSLTITRPQEQALVTQENHYYPLGMALSGVAVNTIPPVASVSKNQFNDGSALQDELLGAEGGVYSTFFRTYDPATGRFTGVDPLADAIMDWTPYQFALGNPIAANDPTGAISNFGGWDSLLRAVTNGQIDEGIYSIERSNGGSESGFNIDKLASAYVENNHLLFGPALDGVISIKALRTYNSGLSSTGQPTIKPWYINSSARSSVIKPENTTEAIFVPSQHAYISRIDGFATAEVGVIKVHDGNYIQVFDNGQIDAEQGGSFIEKTTGGILYTFFSIFSKAEPYYSVGEEFLTSRHNAFDIKRMKRVYDGGWDNIFNEYHKMMSSKH